MNKKILIIILVIAIPVAWYLISPLWRNVALNEASPLAGDSIESTHVIGDDLDIMDEETKAEFKDQVEAMKDETIMMKDEMPGEARVVSQGDFKPRAHDVEGQALLIEKDGKRTLRFENFKTINGPNLHIYLGADLSNDDFVDLGKIKATEGNVNYEVDNSVDIDKYNKIMVWCVPFRVLFSYAELK